MDWLPNSERQDKLQSVQNRFLRIVYNNADTSTNDRHLRMGIGKLNERRDLHLCGMIYKRSRVGEYVDNRDLHTRLFDKIVQLTKSFAMPIFKGSNLWNRLSNEIQKSPTYKEFRYMYKNP